MLVDKREMKTILCMAQGHKTGSVHHYASCGSEPPPISNCAAYKGTANQPLDKDIFLRYGKKEKKKDNVFQDTSKNCALSTILFCLLLYLKNKK